MNALVLPNSGYEIVDKDEMSYSDGGLFIGFGASSTDCVNLWNAASGALERFGVLKSQGAVGLFGIGIYALKTCFATVYAKMTAFLSGVWGKFCSLFTSFGPIGWIVGGIIAIAGFAAIGQVAGMLVAGAMGRGFRLGVEIGWFSSRCVCEWC